MRSALGSAGAATRTLRRVCAGSRRTQSADEARLFTSLQSAETEEGLLPLEGLPPFAFAQDSALPAHTPAGSIMFRVKHLPSQRMTQPDGTVHTIPRNYAFARPVKPTDAVPLDTDVFLHESDCVGTLPRKGQVFFAEVVEEERTDVNDNTGDVEGTNRLRAINAWAPVDLTLHLCKELNAAKATIAQMHERIEALESRAV